MSTVVLLAFSWTECRGIGCLGTLCDMLPSSSCFVQRLKACGFDLLVESDGIHW